MYIIQFLFFFNSSSARKKNRELTIVSVAHTNIPPKEPVVYTKQTQTIQTSHTSHDGESLYSIFKFIALLCCSCEYETIHNHSKYLNICIILMSI